MPIIDESPDLLIVAERAIGLRSVGGVLVATGMIFLIAGARIGNLTSTLAGAGTLVLGALLVVLPSTTAFHFDRAKKKFTSDYASKAAIANRTSAFLGLPASDVASTATPSPYAIKRVRRSAAVGLASLFVVAGALFASFGGVMLRREYERLSNWLPVQATVLGTHVDILSDSDGDTFRPVVEYRYQVDDRVYTSTRTLPIAESRSGRWAHRVIQRYAVGGRYTAWYDPSTPSEAFIVRAHSIIAPVFALIGVVVTLGGCMAVVSAMRTNE